MHGRWCVRLCPVGFGLFGRLRAVFSYDLLFSFGQFEHFPAYLLACLVITLKVRANVGNYFSCFIFLYQSDDAQNVENLRYVDFVVEIFLLVHESFHHFFDAALGD